MDEIKSKILIVEDEKSLSHILQSELQRQGFETQIAGNGEEAAEILLKQRFDLILLDLLMPVMDGFQLLDLLSQRQDHTPVIVTTNLGQEEDKQKANTYGVKDYFVKTDIPISELIEKIKNFIAASKKITKK